MKKFIFAFNSNKIEKEPLYYNILIDFSSSITNEIVEIPVNAKRSFLLEQSDHNSTGYNRDWSASMTDENGYLHTVRIKGNKNNQYSCYYTYGVPEQSSYASTPRPPMPPPPGGFIQVWDAYINCENPWEATEEQIENHYYVLFPKMTPIPVYE
jgi:hypothetical protein